MLGQTFSKLIIITNYQLNKEYIAANLCVNRFFPQMHCNGQCQLAKKLKAEEDQSNKENSSNTVSKLQSSEVLFFEQKTNFSIGHLFTYKKTTYPSYLVVEYPSPAPAIFHPPAIA